MGNQSAECGEWEILTSAAKLKRSSTLAFSTACAASEDKEPTEVLVVARSRVATRNETRAGVSPREFVFWDAVFCVF